MNKAIKEIRGNDSADLKVQLGDLRKEQFELRFRGTSEGPSTARSRNVRRTISRILTVIGDRDRQANVKQAEVKQAEVKQAEVKQAGVKN